jgi:hypothetical protein
VLLIDAANVFGSRPTGWWRDRAGAARDLVARLRANDHLPGPIVIVLEGAGRHGVEEGIANRVEVVHAPGEGDDTLAELAAPGVTLVTADRGLRERAAGAGADVVGPSWLYDRLDR